MSAGRRRVFVSALLAAAVLGVYLPHLGNPFIVYDDYAFVAGNDRVKTGLSPGNVLWAFSTFETGNYHPLTWLSHMLDAQVWGLDPRGHHLTSFLLHAANTILVFLFLEGATGLVLPSAASAALFGLHPLRVESVAWAAERKDVLAAFLVLLTLIFYARHAGARPGRRAGVAVLAVLALMAKPSAVVVPLLLLAVDLWPLGRWRSAGDILRLVAEKSGLLALSAAWGLMTIYTQRAFMADAESIGPAERLGNALIAYAAYIGRTLWPRNLSVFYPLPTASRPLAAAGAALLLAGATLLLWRARRPFLRAGWLWYLAALLPVAGFLQTGAQSMADRYTYLPSVGLMVILVWGVRGSTAAHPRGAVAAGAVLAAALCLLAWRTSVQLGFWRSSRALFEHALSVTGDNTVALNNLGVAVSREGKMEEAMSYYRRALVQTPGDEKALNNLGGALAAQGRPAEAREKLEEALRSRPDYVLARFNLAELLLRQGLATEAERELKEVLRLDPRHARAHNRLGLLLAGEGRQREALGHFETARRLDPYDARVVYNEALTLTALGRDEEAMDAYRRAQRLDPADAQAHNNLGVLLASRGRLGEARAEFAEALRLKPDFPEAARNLDMAGGGGR